jgi:exosortase
MPTAEVQHKIHNGVRTRGARVRALRISVPRNVLFVFLVAVSVFAFLMPLRNLLHLCLASEEYSYIVLIPVIVLGLFFVDREKIFQHADYSPGTGVLVILAGVVTAGTGTFLTAELGRGIPLALEILGFVTICIGGFVMCYGTGASRAGVFALLSSLLLVPLPHAVIARPIEVVQYGSAEVSSFLFTITGVPVLREGLTFSLPRLRIVVATQCSGIHSMLALFIASLLAGHLYLRSSWKPVVLVLVVLPIVCFTNGLRIFVLSVLAAYLDMSFLTGNLHRRGGVLFFMLALMLLVVVTKMLGGMLATEPRFRPDKGAAPRA